MEWRERTASLEDIMDMTGRQVWKAECLKIKETTMEMDVERFRQCLHYNREKQKKSHL